MLCYVIIFLFRYDLKNTIPIAHHRWLLQLQEASEEADECDSPLHPSLHPSIPPAPPVIIHILSSSFCSVLQCCNQQDKLPFTHHHHCATATPLPRLLHPQHLSSPGVAAAAASVFDVSLSRCARGTSSSSMTVIPVRSSPCWFPQMPFPPWLILLLLTI